MEEPRRKCRFPQFAGSTGGQCDALDRLCQRVGMTRKNLEQRKPEILAEFLDNLDIGQAEAFLLYAVPDEHDRERAVLTIDESLADHPIVKAQANVGFLGYQVCDGWEGADLVFTVSIRMPEPITEVPFQHDSEAFVVAAGLSSPSVVECEPITGWKLKLETCADGERVLAAMRNTGGGLSTYGYSTILGEFSGEAAAKAMIGEYFPQLKTAGVPVMPYFPVT